MFSGTTLLHQIISLILCEDAKQMNDIDKTNILNRFIYVDHKGDNPNAIQDFTEMNSPRLLKSHLPFFITKHWFETEDVKIVSILRNPKDTLVALFHFYKGVAGKSSQFYQNFFFLIYFNLIKKLYI